MLQYDNQIKRLKSNDIEVNKIENAVKKAIENVQSERNFVIFGEPQSGKTEMMIVLTSKLLDMNKKIIIHLMNDSVSLLNQNLERFSKSGINPSPKNFSEIEGQEWHLNYPCIIFCKKNAKNLKTLIRLLENKQEESIIIDDEADYATPNAKVNKKDEQTRIHELVGKLEQKSQYIGVTATPARLDLNDTFMNDIDKWIYFKPYDEYKGHDVFFPSDLNVTGREQLQFNLKLLPDQNDAPKYIREALLDFMINVANLNTQKSEEENYSILIHTSGRKDDHQKDKKNIEKVMQDIAGQKDSIIKEIRDICETKTLNRHDRQRIQGYILNNVLRNQIIVLNSDVEKHFTNNKMATHPTTPFTIVIGGNIVSRGITFQNLLSMFFTRTVKKIQQDTYIQRARMFGNRKNLKYFTLYVTKSLYLEWHKCFMFHRMSLNAVKKGEKPCWIESSKNKAVSSSSIKKETVFTAKGEWYFKLFDFNSDIMPNELQKGKEALREIQKAIGDDGFKKFALDFILENTENDEEICIYRPVKIESRTDADHENILRKRGLIGGDVITEPGRYHHVRVFYNEKGRARLYYRYTKETLKFLTSNR